MGRTSLALATAWALAALVAGRTAPTAARFSATSSNAGSSFAAAADWAPPTASSTVIAKTTGGTAGFIRQGGTYYVYANVTDTGNPASGISTVKANVSTISTGQTAVAFVAGSYSIGGVSYGYRTASVTANAVLSAGTATYSITSTDVAGNSGTQTGFTVTVDNTAPTGSDVQTTNVTGGTVGKAELGDKLTFTFSEPIDPISIIAGWTGTSTNVVVRINNASPDTFQVFDPTNTTQLPLGTVSLGNNGYVTANRTFGATGTGSTMVLSGSTITVTLGTASGTTSTVAATGSMTWPPSATATDRAGNACTTTTVTESGTADVEF